MARGQSQAADKNLATTNAIGADYNTRSKKLEGQLIPGYTSLMKSGYLSPEEEAAASVSEMGSASAPFKSMQFEAANRAGRTNNAADLTAQQDQLAMDEGRTANTAASNLQKEKMAGQVAGMYGLSGLRGEDLKAMQSLYGLGPGTLDARASGGSGDQTAIGYLNAFKSNGGG